VELLVAQLVGRTATKNGPVHLSPHLVVRASARVCPA
jgi:hypothetical protein